MMSKHSSRAAMAAVAFLTAGLIVATAPAEETPQQYATLLTPIIASGETVLGQPIAYPAGKAKVTAAIVEIPPGGSTGLHTHRVPLFAYMLEGEITIDYGSKGVRTYRSGEGFLEAMDWTHNGTNNGTVPARLVAVYIGAEDIPNAEATAAAD